MRLYFEFLGVIDDKRAGIQELIHFFQLDLLPARTVIPSEPN